MAATTQSQWVPKTKFYPPLPAADDLPRLRLLETLQNTVTARRLTLISAPAGSGKTTLAAQFVYGSPDTPCAWLRLGSEDDEPAAFLASLLAALRQAAPWLGQEAANLLYSLPNAGARWRQIVGLLVNDLLDSSLPYLVLVLDDYHTIQSSQVHEVCGYLLDNMPPNLHLLITTRIDPPLPLARLRLRGELAEVRLPDLRFEPDETRAYFKDRWGIELAPDELDELQRRTEGWVASLHLLAMALSHLPGPERRAAFLAEFSRSNQLIFQLLAEEVLAQQPPELRVFLLETSILSELTPALCTTVTGDPQAASLLAGAYRRNLFLSAVDRRASADTAYRYHDLFAAFLQRRLAEEYPDRLSDLHRRAAQSHPDPAEQVRHFLAAEMWEQAAQAIEHIGWTLLAQGRLNRLQGWLAALPAALVGDCPQLLYFQGAGALQRGDYTTAEKALEQALAGFRSVGDEQGQGRTLLLLANLASGLHDPPRTFTLLQEALGLPLSLPQQVQAHITTAWMHIYTGRIAEGAREALTAVHLAEKANDPVAFNILGLQLRSALLFGDEGIAPFERYCRQMLHRLDETPSPVRLGATSLLSLILFMRGEFEAAEALHRQAVEMNSLLGSFVYIQLEIDFNELSIHLRRGNKRAFADYWQKRLPAYEQPGGLHEWLATFLFLRALDLCLSGRWQEAQPLLTRMQAAVRPDGTYENRLVCLTLAGMLALGDGRVAEAETILRDAIALNNRNRYGILMCSPHLWLAHLYRLSHRPQHALDVIRELFSVYDPAEVGAWLLREGPILAPLLELAVEHNVHPASARRLLQIWGEVNAPVAIPVPHTAESLSPREMEVLHLLATGASNRAIAETLVITERTAKAHVSSILSKLDVKSRTQAVAKARVFHII